MEDHEQNENRPASVRIHPKKSDALLLSALFLVCIVILIIGHWEHWEIPQDKTYSVAFGVSIYCIFLYSRVFRRVSVDSRKLQYYILGLIPVDIYWYDVAQIGTVFISSKYPVREKDIGVLGEMFVLVLKPCKKYEEGSRTIRWWHIRPKWRHPFLVKNIYCDTEKYKEIIEAYSRKKVSFEIRYR